MEKHNIPQLLDIQQAHQRIRAYIHRTPLQTCAAIDAIAGCQIYFKCENLQKVGAFKARGATNAVLKLSGNLRANGVATHSSGNHAAALARAATKVGVKSYIVMPSSAPEIKKAAVRTYGGEIIECEPTLAAREEMLIKVVNETGATFIPPYNHMDIIEGQATCALEMWEENIAFDSILTPVGGGGLLAGTALVTHYLNKKAKVYAGEPEGANDAWQSFRAGSLIPVYQPKTIADGLMTSLGDITFQLIKTHVKDVFTVSEEEIVSAMRLIYERLKLVIEPSSAVPLAALLANKELFAGKNIGIILSGGNVDLSKLPF